MKEIPLTKGAVALVDDEDYEELSQFSWRLQDDRNCTYAIRAERKRTVRMHRQIMCPPADMQVDHINGNGLDNRRCNLRLATREQNMRNRPPSLGKLFKGVCETEPRLFRARIKVGSRDLSLGCYRTQEDAARAYDRAAVEHYGEFAWLNFPDEQQQSNAA